MQNSVSTIVLVLILVAVVLFGGVWYYQQTHKAPDESKGGLQLNVGGSNSSDNSKTSY